MSRSAERERMRRIGELMTAALDHDEASRGAFLEQACGGDAVLRREVESLLAAHARKGPLDRLVVDLAPLTARLRAPRPSLTGTRIAHYRIEGRIGGGGMGVVYRALDSNTGREVAFKVLSPTLDNQPSARARFRQEARIISEADHPNICGVHEIGEMGDGLLFVAMPLYEGKTLRERLEHGAIPLGEALGMAAQIARALANVHERGIIHRDIKPSNLLVRSDGVVKLLDFGIAKLAGVALTGPARPPGTLAYMSPEQVSEQEVDHRTDLWSLGVVLYEMLAGRHPFPGKTRAAVLHAIQRAEPARLTGPPAAASEIVSKSLAKPMKARYASAAEMEAALLAALSP